LTAALCSTVLLIAPICRAAPATQPTGKPIIAVFDLAGEMAEQPADQSIPLLSTPGPSLRDVVLRMKKAADDPQVKALVILADSSSFGLAQAQELRQAMQTFRASGKEIYAHSDSLGMGQYILLSGSSRLSVSPIGDMWVLGLYGDAPYLHGLLEKLGIHADYLHCGAYKSASEMFMREGPSPEAEAMQNWLLDSIYQSSIKLIADGRKTTEKQVRDWIDAGPYNAEKAKAAGMIDAVEQREDFEAMLKEKYGSDLTFEKRYGQPKPPQLDLSNPFSLITTFAQLMGAQKSGAAKSPAVGVVYVDGMIMLGKGEPSLTGGSFATSTDIAAALDQAARDDSIKAVVLRIDSPGGSAVASEIILAATQRLKAKKPFVVSMGDVAGSGGYYVACAADTIFADESTITASIGVVAGKFATTDMWNKVGVTWKAYQRGANAGLLSTDNVFTPAEHERMQAWMDEIYGVFKNHVTASRGNRLKKPIDDLAGGRVFTGRQALELGLVDRIGTLQDAITYIAGQANLKEYDVRSVPEPKNLLQQIMEQAAGGDNDPAHLLTPAVRADDSLLKLAAPYLTQIDPQRTHQIQTALRELQLIQHEGAALIMPEMRFTDARNGR
jgi:protease-4